MSKIIPFTLTIIMVVISMTVNSSEISVKLSGGIEKINSLREHRISYFSMSQLAEILGESISWDIVGISAVLETEKNRMTFFINSPYINVNDTVKNLIYPVKMIKGSLYLPAGTFLPLLDLARSERIVWDEGRDVIRIDSEWYNITDLAMSPKSNGLLIEIFVSEPVDYEIYVSEGNWLNVTVPGGRVNLRQLLSRKSGKYLKDMNVFQFEGSAQISLRQKQRIGKYTHRFQPNPGRIQISLLDTTIVSVAQRGVDKVGPDERIDKIIIDAGHGGKDYGAIGLRKTQEKKIVLDIAKRLAKLIRKEKLFEVIMTREKDEYVSLEERASIANSSNGDIFISIHANASPKRSARGFQVFFLAPANNDEARAAAQLENAPFLAELDTDLDGQMDNLSFILSDMIQTEFQQESADLASMVDREFRKKLSRKTRARGIDQAGFVVLNQVYMPSILVEAAFVTNRNDENLLKDKHYRQEMAEAVYSGLKRFKDKYEN
jgi:N-acetylmuramoyl-L-alanine amidase